MTDPRIELHPLGFHRARAIPSAAELRDYCNPRYYQSESGLSRHDHPDDDHLSYFTAESLTRLAENCGWVLRDIVADFPIDLFLLHPASNYQRNPEMGPDAHRARVAFELLLGALPPEPVNDLYRAMAAVGLGRDLAAFLQPSAEVPADGESGR